MQYVTFRFYSPFATLFNLSEQPPIHRTKYAINHNNRPSCVAIFIWDRVVHQKASPISSPGWPACRPRPRTTIHKEDNKWCKIINGTLAGTTIAPPTKSKRKRSYFARAIFNSTPNSEIRFLYPLNTGKDVALLTRVRYNPMRFLNPWLSQVKVTANRKLTVRQL